MSDLETLSSDLLERIHAAGDIPALEAAYFVKGSADERTKTAKVTEVLPVTFNSMGTELSFKVTHFSGYMVSTGRTR